MYPVLVSPRKGQSPPISASSCCFIFGWDLTVVIRRGGGPQKLFLHYCKTLISDRLGFLSLFFGGGGRVYLCSEFWICNIRCFSYLQKFMFNSDWLLCIHFLLLHFWEEIFIGCSAFIFMFLLYTGFVWMLSAISHSFGNVLFFLELAIIGI